MLGLFGGKRLVVNSAGAVSTDEMLKTGVRDRPDVSAIATRRDREIVVLAWNYHDDDVQSPEFPLPQDWFWSSTFVWTAATATRLPSGNGWVLRCILLPTNIADWKIRVSCNS
jgi:hypothetical protein